MFMGFFFGLLIWVVPSQLNFASELIERQTNYAALLNTEIEVLNVAVEEVKVAVVLDGVDEAL